MLMAGRNLGTTLHAALRPDEQPPADAAYAGPRWQEIVGAAGSACLVLGAILPLVGPPASPALASPARGQHYSGPGALNDTTCIGKDFATANATFSGGGWRRLWQGGISANGSSYAGGGSGGGILLEAPVVNVSGNVAANGGGGGSLFGKPGESGRLDDIRAAGGIAPDQSNGGNGGAGAAGASPASAARGALTRT